MKIDFTALAQQLDGEFFTDELVKSLYATDASVYREIPMAVVYPKHEADIQQVIRFCAAHQLHVIPRAAGTSLAGQCVGSGVVVDVSVHLTDIIAFDKAKKQVRVQPGVVRDDLNRFLKPYGLFFGPNTSTSNRCTIGGMVGNNSSGTTSIKYGVTRDKVVQLRTLLSDASVAEFSSDHESVTNAYQQKIIRHLQELLQDEALKSAIKTQFPKPSIHRRNTGYALDSLLNEADFNIAKLLSGSEGTLAFTTEVTLQLDDLPPSKNLIVAAQFYSITDCLQAVAPLMENPLFTCEMMDKTILDCTQESLKYRENRFFIEGDPAAILLLEICAETETELHQQKAQLLADIQQKTNAYAYPVLQGEEIEMAVELRKAGLGLLANMRGDKKAVACIEDTAVALPDLAAYIDEFTQLMKSFGQEAVYYAHAGAGELHLRPILNLKKQHDVQLFQEITAAVAKLVKKYQGAFSGEHGDGRVRSPFIKELVGKTVYQAFIEVKQLFDPKAIFNPEKIVHPREMTKNLRYEPNRTEPSVPTFMDFSDSGGFLNAVERCNGSGDCRKSADAAGSMCPSYHATHHEKDTTRARANALREFITQSTQANPFNQDELKSVLALCISCKACKNECPSNVDMATYKAEFLYQYQQANGVRFRDKLFAHTTRLNAFAAKFSGLSNAIFSNALTGSLIKSVMGMAPQRSFPKLAKHSLRQLIVSGKLNLQPTQKKGRVYLFIDEFTNVLDVSLGVKSVELLVGLGYEVLVVHHAESGRSFLSKGFLKEAKAVADKNIAVFETLVSAETPLLGIEPSAILSFRDEYLRLATNASAAKKVAKHALLIEEFLVSELTKGNLHSNQFHKEPKSLKIHAHCHQKALSTTKHTFDLLNLPQNYRVTLLPTGCCGMAGSFGYEKEHYDISMQIGERKLFPAVRKAEDDCLIVANGTSCRHQVYDGTGKTAYHPIAILRDALR